MSKRYRGIVFAVGLALASHHPSVEAKGEQSDRSESIAESLDDIASTYREQSERSERASESQPCKPGDDKRDSDLCAQWKAADAAANSAWWARVGTWVSGISGLFVVVALFLAFQSNRIARESAERQLRAYVVTAGLDCEWTTRLTDGQLGLNLKVLFVNAGQTPALTTKFVCCVGFGGVPENLDEQSWPFSETITVVGPGTRLEAPQIWVPEAVVLEIYRGTKSAFLYGIATYKDIFEVKRETRFLWHLTFGKSSDADRPNRPRWECVGTHNTAT